MIVLTEAEEEALYALGTKIETGFDWWDIAAMTGRAPSDLMADAWTALRKLQADD